MTCERIGTNIFLSLLLIHYMTVLLTKMMLIVLYVVFEIGYAVYFDSKLEIFEGLVFPRKTSPEPSCQKNAFSLFF